MFDLGGQHDWHILAWYDYQLKHVRLTLVQKTAIRVKRDAILIGVYY